MQSMLTHSTVLRIHTNLLVVMQRNCTTPIHTVLRLLRENLPVSTKKIMQGLSKVRHTPKCMVLTLLHCNLPTSMMSTRKHTRRSSVRWWTTSIARLKAQMTWRLPWTHFSIWSNGSVIRDAARPVPNQPMTMLKQVRPGKHKLML